MEARMQFGYVDCFAMFDHPLRCRLPLEPGIAASNILGPFGADSDLRGHGLHLAREATANGQEAGRRCCRTKLAVLLLTL